MNEQDFINYARKVGEKHPELQSEIQEIYELMICEIEDGESESHEVELAIDSIDDLLDNVGE